ncbi:MAG TPA: O-antigen ligase family protein [Tepidisphaeraceae bacterium]|nr:O-antigen ligase family protein [Tepidisphaeraceae bacterium]
MTTKFRYYRTVRDPRPVDDWRAMLTQAALVLALALAACRCMLLETIRDPFDINVGGVAIPLGTGADASLVLDLLCCIPAMLVLLRRCLDKTYTIRWGWSLALIAPLAIWMAASVGWADDQFADVISTANFVAAMALLWAMAQIVRSWLRLRVVAAVAYGLLLTFLVCGFEYKFVEMPGLQEQQTKLLQQQGLDPNSFAGQAFVRKIGELVGFNASANSFAGLIVLLMTIGLGVVIQRVKDRDDPGWAVALAIFFPLAIWLLVDTQSKAALVMPVLVIGLFAILWRWRGPIARQSKRWFWIGCGIVALCIAAVIGHGLFHHGLPTASLNFRWRYWSAAWRMFLRHPIRGFGWENFGPHYVRDRLPAASEEIRDPHDFLIRFFVELGAVGGILLVAWLGRLWWDLTRPVAPPAVVPPPAKTPNYRDILFLCVIAVVAILINTLASVDFAQSTGYIAMAMIKRLLYLCALVIGCLVVSLRNLENPRIDERPAPWILYGILVGVGVFLIHNLIEFSIFEPGPTCLFGILVGAALGIRLGNPPVRTPHISRIAIGALAATCAIWFAAVGWIVVPVCRAEAAAHLGDEQLLAGHFQAASNDYGYADQILPMNADYAFRAGRALHISVGPPVTLTNPEELDRAVRLKKQIISWYTIAIDKDPVFLAAYHLRAIFWLQTGNADRMIADFDKVMQLNPNEVSLRLEYARDLEMFHLLPQAKKQYELALSYNDQLDKAEPKRLTQKNEDAARKEMEPLPAE